MRLRKLRLLNFGIHRDRTFEFADGVNLIVGRNGAGKSTLINAFLFAMINDLSRMEGKKEATINKLAPASEKSQVELWFDHAGLDFYILRTLRGEKTRMEVTHNGKPVESVIKGDTAVTAAVLRYLKTTKEILTGYVYVEQLKLFAPFDPSVMESQRLAAMQALFQYDRIEEIWKALGEALNKMPPVTIPDLGVYQDAERRTAAALAAEQGVVAQYAALAGWRPETDPDTALCHTYNTATGHLAAVQQYTTSEAATRATMEARQYEVNQLTPRVTAMYGELTAAAARIPALRETLQQFEAASAQNARIAVADQTLFNAREELQQANAALAAKREEIEQAALQEATTRQLLADCDQRIGTLNARSVPLADDAPTCPLCRQPVSQDFRELIASDRQRLTIEQTNRQRLEAELSRLSQVVTSNHFLAKNVESAQNRVAKAEQLRQQAGAAATGPSVDEANQARQYIAWYDETNRTYASENARLARLNADLTVATEQHRRTLELLQAAQKTVADLCVPTPAEFQAAAARLQERQNQYTMYQVAQTKLASCQQQWEYAAAQLAAANDQIRRLGVQKAVHERLSLLRDRCHRDNLPRTLVKKQLTRLTDTTNMALEMLGIEFRVTSDESGVNYDAHFPDGNEQPVVRLSPGQRTMFASGFRIALNARQANDLGQLSLDEPTTSLDQENRALLVGRVLEALKTFSHKRGLQCFIITHETTPGADQIIHV